MKSLSRSLLVALFFTAFSAFADSESEKTEVSNEDLGILKLLVEAKQMEEVERIVDAEFNEEFRNWFGKRRKADLEAGEGTRKIGYFMERLGLERMAELPAPKLIYLLSRSDFFTIERIQESLAQRRLEDPTIETPSRKVSVEYLESTVIAAMFARVARHLDAENQNQIFGYRRVIIRPRVVAVLLGLAAMPAHQHYDARPFTEVFADWAARSAGSSIQSLEVLAGKAAQLAERVSWLPDSALWMLTGYAGIATASKIAEIWGNSENRGMIQRSLTRAIQRLNELSEMPAYGKIMRFAFYQLFRQSDVSGVTDAQIRAVLNSGEITVVPEITTMDRIRARLALEGRTAKPNESARESARPTAQAVRGDFAPRQEAARGDFAPLDGVRGNFEVHRPPSRASFTSCAGIFAI